MLRISSHMPNDDMQYHLRLQEFKMNDLQAKMAEQTRVKELRDDPLAAAHSTRYQSHIARLERYLDNNEKVQGKLRISEQYLQSANELLHRIRELTVQGANGTYTEEQRKMMAVEVNELLNELVETANARSGDGTAIFAGDANLDRPFTALTGNVAGADGRVITSVRYNGGPARNQAEISEASYVDAAFSGGDVFWAENQEIMTDVDASSYVVRGDSAIFIDGERIDLSAGDNVHAIVAKINESNAAVKASLDPVDQSLVIRSTYPHQLRLEDSQGDSVLRDLGVVSGIGGPPYNYASNARVSGGSVFDMIIYLRDRLYAGETLNVGGAGLKGIDQAQQNVLTSLASLGSRSERLDIVYSRISAEIPEMIQRNSNEVDLDVTQAILDLKAQEYAHKAALQTAGRVLQPTLLDFLR
jgi:flagellar hook-associated protein 3 FlgL